MMPSAVGPRGIPVVSAPINLGTRFEVSVRGLDQFDRVGRELRDAYTALIQAGGQPFGDWAAVLELFEGMSQRVKLNLERVNAVVGIMHGEDIIGAWNAQVNAGNWRQLTADYLAWKLAQGLDSRTLIATGDAINSLGYQLEPMAVVVGVTAESEDGTPYMIVQEFGSADGDIPPRPLFAPTLEANLDRYVRAFSEAVQMALQGRVYPDLAAGAVA